MTLFEAINKNKGKSINIDGADLMYLFLGCSAAVFADDGVTEEQQDACLKMALTVLDMLNEHPNKAKDLIKRAKIAAKITGDVPDEVEEQVQEIEGKMRELKKLLDKLGE